MSSLTVSFSTPALPPVPPPPRAGWTILGSVHRALASLATLGRYCVDALIYAAVFGVPVAGLLFLVLLAAQVVLKQAAAVEGSGAQGHPSFNSNE